MSGRASQIPRPVPDARGYRDDLQLQMDATTTSTKRPRHPSTSSNGSASSTGRSNDKAVKKKPSLHRETDASTFAAAGTSSSTRPPTEATHANSATTPATDTSHPPLRHADDSMPPPPPPAATQEQDDGFTIVTSRRHRSHKGPREIPAALSGNDSHLATSQPPARTATRNAPANPPAQQPARPSVSVTRQAPLNTNYPAFRVPVTEEFPISYDAVAALEEEHPHLLMRNLIGKDNSSVLLPKDEATFITLDQLASEPSNWLRLVKIEPAAQLSRGVVMGYPLRMPTALLLRHPQVEEATRCLTSRQQDETRQVLVSVRGPLPPHIDLGNWGTYYLRPYTREPLRCFRCQRYGHHKDNCSRAVTCGICSGGHWTEKCLTLYKEKKEVRHRCANCGAAHHAWNPACPVRLQRVHQDRERQVTWVQEQQKTSTAPAPPGTFVWGQQQRHTAPPMPLQQPRPGPSDTQQDFPPLPDTLTPAPLQATRPPPASHSPPTKSVPPQSGAAAPSPPTTLTPPPSTTQVNLPPGAFIMTADLLHTMVKDLTIMSATAFQQVSGVRMDMEAFQLVVDKMAEEIVGKVTGKMLALQHQQQDKSPSPPTTQRPHEVPPVTPTPAPRPHLSKPHMRTAQPPSPTPPVSTGQDRCESVNGTAGGSALTLPPSGKQPYGIRSTYSSSRRRFSR